MSDSPTNYSDAGLAGIDRRITKNVVDTLARLGPTSRAALVETLGIGRSTLARAVGMLMDARMVVEIAQPAQGRGRPRALLAVNPRAASAIGLDLGMRHLRGALVDAAHRTVVSEEVKLPLDYSVDEALRAARSLIERFERRSTGPIVGVGLSLPGPVDRASMSLTRSSILPDWAGAPVLASFERSTPYPVFADNESNLAGYAERLWGAATGIDSMIYLKLHSGVGGAILLNGQILRGRHGAAAEFGHLSRNPSGARCRCGNRGCLEAYIGIPPLLSRVSDAYQREITLAEMKHLVAAGDATSLSIVEAAGREAGRALGTLSNALDPEVILIGGSLAGIGDPLMSAIEAGYRASALPTHLGTPIAFAGLGRFASALGATALVLASGFDDLLAGA